MNPLHRLRSTSKKLSGSDLIQIRHDFMMCYGWIPIEQFKKEIKIPELWDLYQLVTKEKKIMYTAYQSMMSFAGMKKGQVNEVFQ